MSVWFGPSGDAFAWSTTAIDLDGAVVARRRWPSLAVAPSRRDASPR